MTAQFVVWAHVLVFRRGGKQFITLSPTFTFLTPAIEVANCNS